MTTDDIRELLSELSKSTDAQLDETVRVRLKNISAKENLHTKDIEAILDDCVYYSLASDFTIEVMETIHKELKRIEDSL